MFNYETYTFISPEPIYAEVKSMLRSYFESGILDDTLFPRWTEHCLRKFDNTTKPLKETVLELDNYQACVPDDFNTVRELWLCTKVYTDPIQDPTYKYYQKDCRLDIPERTGKCDPCFNDDCDGIYKVTHKVTGYTIFAFRKFLMLTPGTTSAKLKCAADCPTFSVENDRKFDIQGQNIVTTFPSGTLYLLYYADSDVDGEMLIPSNFRFEEYLRQYLIYKCYEMLSNLVSDESFNQVQLKLQQSDQKQAEAYILVDIEFKKKNIYQKAQDIKKTHRRLNKYNLP